MLRKLVFTLLAVVVVSSVWISAVSAGQDKVTVCHKPGTPAQATLEIAAPALNAHLGHGDYQGACRGPESVGCTALNAVVPDPQTLPHFYKFQVSDLDFLPGETIHVDMTITIPGAFAGVVGVGVYDSNFNPLAADGGALEFLDPGQHTRSVDYVVVAGDDADGVLAGFDQLDGELDPITLDAVHFSCTPAS